MQGSDLHFAEWSSELAGTWLLVFGGLSAVALDFGAGSHVTTAIPSTGARLLLTGVLFAGTGALVAVSPIGRRSGGHINPAVSLAFWMTRHMRHHDLAGYWVAQFLGAMAGAVTWRLAWGPIAGSVNFGLTVPGAGAGEAEAAVIEAAMTAGLMLTIFAFVARPGTMRWTPLAVWMLVTLLVWQVAPVTGTSLNPARSTGPALASGHLASLWVYFIGPLTGAVIAVGLARMMTFFFWPQTAKLFHDPRYPNIFRHSRPSPMGIEAMLMRKAGSRGA